MPVRRFVPRDTKPLLIELPLETWDRLTTRSEPIKLRGSARPQTEWVAKLILHELDRPKHHPERDNDQLAESVTKERRRTKARAE